jgi:hypothetical protein
MTTMAIEDELRNFVRESLARGVGRGEIEDVLQRAGWSAEQVRKALSGFADIAFPVPVPRPALYLSARDAFLYLVLFATLYISAYHLGSLIFGFIDLALPDPADPPAMADQVHSSMRWSVASLVVAFPTFFYLSVLVGRAVARDPEKRESKVRKWLTYATLLVATGVLIGDCIALVFNLLEGEATLRFLLKVLTAGAIAGTVFGYYLWDLRLVEREVEAR